MADLLRDLRAYAALFLRHWYTLMSGILAVAVWVVGAALEPMPVSLRWSLLACGAVAPWSPAS